MIRFPNVRWRRSRWRGDLLDVHRLDPERYPFLLESVARGNERARYDLLLAFPGERLVSYADGRLEGPGSSAAGGDFLGALDAWFGAELVATATGEGGVGSPFRGGWFLFLAYELASRIEPAVPMPPGPPGELVAVAVRVPAAVVRDHLTGKTLVVAEAGREDLLDALSADLARAPSPPLPAAGPSMEAPGGEGLVEDPPERYLDAVDRTRRYIRAGDVFQVNLSRSWRARLRPGTSDAALYASLRQRNPAPFAGLAMLGEEAILSSSPERLVAFGDGRVDTRPIAGTHPRNADADADQALSRALLGHPKERAEHIMLIDLERNDLGRICEIGSVEVSELMVLESYTHVHHIVSNVRGRLRPGTTPGAVVRAVFPGGTITGCPKVRCMQIIAELEGIRRGPYTGSMGYLNRDGSGDLNILIRTLHRRGDRITLRAGGGIVADSDPERELDETRHKARGPLAALEGWIR